MEYEALTRGAERLPTGTRVRVISVFSGTLQVEGRLERVADEVSLTVPALIEASAAPLQQRFEQTTELMANRIEELQKAARRFDEQSSALVQHVNDTTATLGKRLDESGRTLTSNLDERTTALSQRVDDAVGAHDCIIA